MSAITSFATRSGHTLYASSWINPQTSSSIYDAGYSITGFPTHQTEKFNKDENKVKSFYWIRGLKVRGLNWVEAIRPFIALAWPMCHSSVSEQVRLQVKFDHANSPLDCEITAIVDIMYRSGWRGREDRRARLSPSCKKHELSPHMNLCPLSPRRRWIDDLKRDAWHGRAASIVYFNFRFCTIQIGWLT